MIPRAEYPRPQFVRNEWKNLNGEWNFEIDFSNSGKEREFFNRTNFSRKIIVPFCPESKLSGVEYKDLMPSVWYKREIEIDKEWLQKRVILHFGAVDFKTEVWINGKSVGTHIGGYSSFEFDITDRLIEGKNTIVVCAQDDCRSGKQPTGKQSHEFKSHGCVYTRTTGIWQTVWIESVSNTYIKSTKYYTNYKSNSIIILGECFGDVIDKELHVEAFYKGRKVGENTIDLSSKDFNVNLSLSEKHLWKVGSPNLYDLKMFILENKNVVDEVSSYFGIRNIEIEGKKVLINGKSVFQRLVLDQGFYRDGIYTAPTDDDLKNDIELSMKVGFNGARLHEKIFEPRFLYWADKLGYIVWGENANWGLDITTYNNVKYFLPEWIDTLKRDFNHPSIVGWCPFNETWDIDGTKQDNDFLSTVYQVTKALDITRPVIDTSGNFHVITDIYDVHDYEQDVDKFNNHYKPLKEGNEPYETFSNRQCYNGQPYFVSEYGGIQWVIDNDNEESWGYGNAPKTEQEFINRYKGLTDTLLDNPNMFGFCYTQLYDVEQETNGLYTYDRIPKFDTEIFKKINSRKAAIEE